jgi:uncharacterized protein with GYD domain
MIGYLTKGERMPKYLVQASYTPEGVQGLQKDKASGRKTAVENVLKGIGGKLESLYFAFGDVDVFIVCDIPDNVSAAALSLAVSAKGLVRIKTLPLLTVEEIDQALSKSVPYTAPGSGQK